MFCRRLCLPQAVEVKGTFMQAAVTHAAIPLAVPKMRSLRSPFEEFTPQGNLSVDVKTRRDRIELKIG
jgi:hypothetical protein